MQEVELAKGFRLKPGQYLYGQAFESIKVPESCCGLILPRSTFARIGLILPISLYANLGYCGNLPIIIYNASPVEVEIPPYYRIAQVLFCELTGTAKGYHEQSDAKYQNENHANVSLKDNEFELKKLLTEEEIITYLKG